MPALAGSFRDELWERASQFHDARLTRLSLDAETRGLRITLMWSENDAEEIETTYDFRGVHSFCLLQKESDPADMFSNYAFPSNPLVDDFDIEDAAGRYGRFVLKGMYGWSAVWYCESCTRT